MVDSPRAERVGSVGGGSMDDSGQVPSCGFSIFCLSPAIWGLISEQLSVINYQLSVLCLISKVTSAVIKRSF